MIGRRPTARQVECLEAVGRYGGVERAARELAISPQTLKNNLTELYRRLNVESAVQAAYVLWYRDQ